MKKTSVDDKTDVKPLTFEKKIDGKGIIQVYGTLDLDKFIQRLLSSALVK